MFTIWKLLIETCGSWNLSTDITKMMRRHEFTLLCIVMFTVFMQQWFNMWESSNTMHKIDVIHVRCLVFTVSKTCRMLLKIKLIKKCVLLYKKYNVWAIFFHYIKKYTSNRMYCKVPVKADIIWWMLSSCQHSIYKIISTKSNIFIKMSLIISHGKEDSYWLKLHQTLVSGWYFSDYNALFALLKFLVSGTHESKIMFF